MRVLGIDCGLETTGFGVIDSDGRRHHYVSSGVYRTSAKTPLPNRLLSLYEGVREVIVRQRPDTVAVEDVFAAANVKSALKLAHVRGVVLFAAAQAGLDVGEYSPLEVKMSVVGYGRAVKAQVQTLVASLLQLPEPPRPHDAADALAVALCHAHRAILAPHLAAQRRVG